MHRRDADIINQDRLSQLDFMVVGVGAVGRNVALMLAYIGAARITLVDFDTVEPENLATQGFVPAQLGEPKVNAVCEDIKRIDPEIDVTVHFSRWKRSMAAEVVFCCVDCIKARKFIFNAVKNDCRLFLDGRMTAETFQAHAVYDDDTTVDYRETFFAPGEAQGEACTAKATIYNSNIAAGFLTAAFTKWLRGIDPEPCVNVNVLTAEVVVG